MGTFAIGVKENGEYKYTFNNKRGKTILSSLSHNTKEDCCQNIEYLKQNINNASFILSKTTSTKFYFKILTEDKILCISRKFTTQLRMEKAIQEIKENIITSEILDFTGYEFPEITFD